MLYIDREVIEAAEALFFDSTTAEREAELILLHRQDHPWSEKHHGSAAMMVQQYHNLFTNTFTTLCKVYGTQH